ncbi:MAG: exodeoxyribonuclease VII large subunit [Ruminococcus sp.]|nr:exodeoxyribonuclease VII large subunit [Ruminococcus sp.]
MNIMTVSQLNKRLADTIDKELTFKGAAVKGELSNYKVHSPSGHAYFSLKDPKCAIKCVMFAGNLKRVRFTPKDGMSVLITGNIKVYERDSCCEIVASSMMPLGEDGAVYAQTEEIKERLLEKGIFAAERKRPIPKIPEKIAVVTSDTGAVRHDIMTTVERRFPLCSIEFYASSVQGDTAASSLCRAIALADKSGADTIIVARGGGSAEDLAPFNTEEVTLAVADCLTPVISAVGHEVDTTLTDYAADVRAATPTAAAELATPDMSVILAKLDDERPRLKRLMERVVERKLTALERLDSSLKLASPVHRLDNAERSIENNAEKLKMLMENRLKFLELRLSNTADKLPGLITDKLSDREKQLSMVYTQLNMLSPFNVLDRGYTLVMREGAAVTSVDELTADDKVTVRFSDGSAEAMIVSKKKL